VTSEVAENLAKLKKDARAAEAEQRLASTGWLAAMLRTLVVAVGGADHDAIAAE